MSVPMSIQVTTTYPNIQQLMTCLQCVYNLFSECMSLIENSQRHFQGPLLGCFEYVPYTAPTIVCTINVSIDCKKNKVSNPIIRKNILD